MCPFHRFYLKPRPRRFFLLISNGWFPLSFELSTVPSAHWTTAFFFSWESTKSLSSSIVIIFIASACVILKRSSNLSRKSRWLFLESSVQRFQLFCRFFHSLNNDSYFSLLCCNFLVGMRAFSQKTSTSLITRLSLERRSNFTLRILKNTTLRTCPLDSNLAPVFRSK